MKIGVITNGEKGDSVARIVRAAEARGHECIPLKTVDFILLTDSGRPGLIHPNAKLREIDAVIPRIGRSVTFFGAAVVRQFEQRGVFTLNSSSAILASRDKLAALQILSRHDIGITKSVVIHKASHVEKAIGRVGGVPVVIKLVTGTHGVGVMYAGTVEAARAMLETMQALQQPVLIQRFIEESRGTDYRAFVVGRKVVAAAQRRSTKDFRSNVHRGGQAKRVDLDPEFQRIAIRATQILGLGMAGVDMLKSKDGPLVMEINSSPGIHGIETCTGIDIATAIIEYMESQVRFPDLDLRQRLMTAEGWNVVDIRVSKTGALSGVRLGCLEEYQDRMRVLCVHRKGHAHALPANDFKLAAGDVLTCYGRQDVLSKPPFRRV